eukprot:XP_001691610.1 WNK protein kinase [Chlamydomonas reinhardtii]
MPLAGASLWPAGPTTEAEEVETSPSGRYIRYNILLGKGACKRVYKAFDTEAGTEVAWNQVDLLGMDHDEEARQHLYEEIRVLQKLKHKNIMTNFITELFTAGNLRQYRKKLKYMSENVLKRWSHQILEGLLYLHGHVPPIVHRDLKCDNIFVNSATGEVKIGDLGLATFMAPEVYDESYDERCDIYSFGMCLLELATLEYPYAECHSVPQIFKKVTLGIPPASLQRVSSPELREFIALCIAHNPADRLSARELLKHHYLESVHADTSAHGGLPGSMSVSGGTLHAGNSFRDLREALHQQETLARAQQLHAHGHAHPHGHPHHHPPQHTNSTGQLLPLPHALSQPNNIPGGGGYLPYPHPPQPSHLAPPGLFAPGVRGPSGSQVTAGSSVSANGMAPMDTGPSTGLTPPASFTRNSPLRGGSICLAALHVPSSPPGSSGAAGVSAGVMSPLARSNSTDSEDDSDEEVLVPIELLKAGMLEEGFIDEDEDMEDAGDDGDDVDRAPGVACAPPGEASCRSMLSYSSVGSDPSALSLVEDEAAAAMSTLAGSTSDHSSFSAAASAFARLSSSVGAESVPASVRGTSTGVSVGAASAGGGFTRAVPRAAGAAAAGSDDAAQYPFDLDPAAQHQKALERRSQEQAQQAQHAQHVKGGAERPLDTKSLERVSSHSHGGSFGSVSNISIGIAAMASSPPAPSGAHDLLRPGPRTGAAAHAGAATAAVGAFGSADVSTSTKATLTSPPGTAEHSRVCSLDVTFGAGSIPSSSSAAMGAIAAVAGGGCGEGGRSTPTAAAFVKLPSFRNKVMLTSVAAPLAFGHLGGGDGVGGVLLPSKALSTSGVLAGSDSETGRVDSPRPVASVAPPSRFLRTTSARLRTGGSVQQDIKAANSNCLPGAKSGNGGCAAAAEVPFGRVSMPSGGAGSHDRHLLPPLPHHAEGPGAASGSGDSRQSSVVMPPTSDALLRAGSAAGPGDLIGLMGDPSVLTAAIAGTSPGSANGGVAAAAAPAAALLQPHPSPAAEADEDEDSDPDDPLAAMMRRRGHQMEGSAETVEIISQGVRPIVGVIMRLKQWKRLARDHSANSTSPRRASKRLATKRAHFNVHFSMTQQSVEKSGKSATNGLQIVDEFQDDDEYEEEEDAGGDERPGEENGPDSAKAGKLAGWFKSLFKKDKAGKPSSKRSSASSSRNASTTQHAPQKAPSPAPSKPLSPSGDALKSPTPPAHPPPPASFRSKSQHSLAHASPNGTSATSPRFAPGKVSPTGEPQEPSTPTANGAPAAGGDAVLVSPASRSKSMSLKSELNRLRQSPLQHSKSFTELSQKARIIPKRGNEVLIVSPTVPPRMQRAEWSLRDYAVVEKMYKLHGKLAHGNVIGLYGAFQVDSQVVMVQEFADGGDLFTLLHSLTFAALWLGVVGILHRDLKPENILFTRNMTFKLCDFGLAIDLRDERAVTRAGTLEYMAPEVLECPFKSRPIDNKDNERLHYTAAVDSWAVGVLAYELLVGRPPFEAPEREGVEDCIRKQGGAAKAASRAIAAAGGMDDDDLGVGALANRMKSYTAGKAIAISHQALQANRHVHLPHAMQQQGGGGGAPKLAALNPKLAATLGVGAAAGLVGRTASVSRIM